MAHSTLTNAGGQPALGPLFLAPASLVPPEYQHITHEPRPTPEAGNPFWVGERYVPLRKLPSGELEYETVPLTLDDLLFPQEGDRALEAEVHNRDLGYLRLALYMHLGNPLPGGMVVLSNHLVDFGAPGIKALGPDIAVIDGVSNRLHLPTFYVQTEGGRTRLIIEDASPNTRQNDMGLKFDLYWRVGVERYVLIDRGPKNESPVSIAGYERGASGWTRIEPAQNGRVPLGLSGAELGVEADCVWLYGAAGQRYPEGDAAYRQAIEATERAKAAEEARQAESAARQAAEARANSLAAQLAQLQAQFGSQQPPTQPD